MGIYLRRGSAPPPLTPGCIYQHAGGVIGREKLLSRRLLLETVRRPHYGLWAKLSVYLCREYYGKRHRSICIENLHVTQVEGLKWVGFIRFMCMGALAEVRHLIELW